MDGLRGAHSWGGRVSGPRRRGRSTTSTRSVLSITPVLLAVAVVVLAGCSGPLPGPDARDPAPPTASTGASTDAAVAGAVAGPRVPADPGSSAPATVLKDFAPLNPQGELTVPARPDGAGSCFATSIAVPVAGVYRCLAGNTLLDPCFAPAGSPSPAAVTCFTDPWTAGRTVTLTRPLPPYDPQFTRTSPWALQLGNGARCVVVTGTVPALGSIDLTYTCGPTTMAGITVAADGVMTAHYGPATGPLTDVTVAVAWRGLSHRIG